MSASDPAFTMIGNPAGAFLIVPDLAQDDPLGPEDLPIGDAPVIVGNIDFSRLAAAYRDAIAGMSDARALLPDLATLSRASEKSRLDLLTCMLIDHDRKAHRAAGFTRFEEYYSRAVGKVVRWPTIRRQLAEIKVALVLTSHGCRTLPSQTRSDILCKIMPRRHWVHFWREICGLRGDGKIGEKSFASELERYLTENDLPAVGERADMKPHATTSALKTNEQGQKAEPPKRTRREREHALIQAIEPLLARLSSPKNARGRSRSIPTKRWLSAVRKGTRKKVNTEKLVLWKTIRATIAERMPELADRLEYQLFLLFQSEIEAPRLRVKPKDKKLPRTEEIRMIKGPSIYRAVG
ncbi:MAG: hypothetical protein WCH98_02740 [Verrucomicrobiota bacterium]